MEIETENLEIRQLTVKKGHACLNKKEGNNMEDVAYREQWQAKMV